MSMGQEVGHLMISEVPLCCPLCGFLMTWRGAFEDIDERHFHCRQCGALMPLDTAMQLLSPLLDMVHHQ